MKSRSWVMLAMLLAITTSAFAYPTLTAATGLINVPTGCAMPQGGVALAGDLVSGNDAVNLRGVWGIGPRFEGGIGITTGDNSGLSVSGKYQVPTGTGNMVWGIGGTLLVSDEDFGDGMQLYVAGTVPLGPVSGGQILGTGGISLTDTDYASGLRPFLGLQLPLSAATEVVGDVIFETGDFANTVTALAIRHRFAGRFMGQLGVTNAIGFDGRNDHDLFLGAAMSL